MKKIILSFFLLASFFGKGQAINFGNLGIGFDNNSVRSLFYDTLDKKLYAGGHFKYADNKIAWGVAVWNGNFWDSLAGGLTQYPQNTSGASYSTNFIYKMIKFQNKIYCIGSFDYVNGKPAAEIAVWNGVTWEFPIAEHPNWQIQDLLVFNNILYACGLFTKFGNTTCNYIAKFDGNSWQPVGDFTKYCKNSGLPAQMNAITVFRDEIYVGGAWDDSTGTTRNIAKFDGSNWINVGTGISQGGVNSVFDLEVFKDELYIGGRFSKTNEIPGNSLVKWDGASYKTIGYDQLTSGSFISQLKSSKKHLAAIGNFQNIGDTGTYNLFYLDSNTACYINDLKSMYLNGGLVCAEYINDSLIVGGSFTMLGNVNANCVGVITNYDVNTNCFYVGINNRTINENIVSLFPNPFQDRLNITFDSDVFYKIRLRITNTLGQIVYSKNNLEQKQEIDLRFLPSGVYFIKLQNNSEQKVFKLIKD